MAQNTTIETRGFLPRIKTDIDQRFPIASFFLFLMLALRVTLNIPLPDILFILVAIILLSSIAIDFLIDRIKTKKPQTAINYYFGYLIFDLFLLTLIINFLGGVTWIIPGIYLFYIITVFWLLPRAQATFLVGWTTFLFVLLAFGNYFGILPQLDIFSPEDKNPQNFPFVLTTATAALAILGFFGYSGDIFYRLLDKKIKELREKGKELVLTKRSLETEVEKRTRELQGERKIMEKLIEEKTRELEKKKEIVVTKVKELEKFHKMAVARELKMAEIKAKITKLK